ncbi:fimbrial protein [Entomohabitans teleogrylli]|uniref:fimbrial protein n=1 Tax=Entomohabitans teleogrylli TaxID=1384589 RepID=UPI00073D938B|nr:fimbrial protein [Entomohabitans teleogrylli]
MNINQGGLSLAFCLLLTATVVLAESGSLIVSGAITTSTCTVLGVISDKDIGTGQPEINPSITLGNLSEYDNSANSFRWFQIHLKDCYASASQNRIRIRLSSPYADKNGYLGNAISNGAQGKVIVFYERNLDTNNSQFLPIGQGRSATAFRTLPMAGNTGVDGTIRFGFIASALDAYNETVTPGPFTTSVNYEIEYQ